MSARVMDRNLAELAEKAGILCHWRDASGHMQQVGEPTVHSLLKALGLDGSSASQIRDSMQQLEEERDVRAGDLVVADAGHAPWLRYPRATDWTLEYESGRVTHGMARPVRPGWISIDPVDEPGYHTLILGELSLILAVVPQRAPAVQPPQGGSVRAWGAVAQVYSLRCTVDHDYPAWMQGANFSAVERLARHAAQRGASALALSPVHAMFSADPDRYSPYSPSSRLFLNVCYADPFPVLGANLVNEALRRQKLPTVEFLSDAGQLLDWPAIASARLELLRSVFALFRSPGNGQEGRRFDDFRRAGGTDLRRHALHETLHAHFTSTLGPDHGWQDWPLPFHNPDGAAVRCFAEGHGEDVLFHEFAQWLAFEGLSQAQAGARDAGMSCGLITDLAIGTDPGGSHAWSLQDDILKAVAVGAPPDVYQAQGQNWGLTAFSPRGLRRNAYASFIATLRANLRCAGGIRIDHIAGMERLWLIPEGAQAAEGAYLCFPRRHLLGLITLEAMRHDAIVIGENLGTVSDELNSALEKQGILGTSVLWFEREPDAGCDEGSTPGFRPSAQWSDQAVAMATTHDLPTVRGWWQERDIYWRALLGQLDPEEEKLERNERARQRVQLWDALVKAGGTLQQRAAVSDETPLIPVLSFVARAPAPLALFALEDLLGVLDQPNMPGGRARHGWVEHPNWVQQLPLPVDEVFRDAAVSKCVDAICRERGAS